jgi:hypothetical protein
LRYPLAGTPLVSRVKLIRNGSGAGYSDGAENVEKERELLNGGCYSVTKDLIGPESYAALTAQLNAVQQWMADPLNVERSSARLAEATRDSHVRSVRDMLGHAVRVRGAAPCLSTLLNGPAVMGYVRFMRQRGLKPRTTVKAVTHLNNIVRVLTSTSGRMLLNPPLSDREVADCTQLGVQLSALCAQLASEEPKRPPATPQQRVADGDWPEGGHATLQRAAAQHAATVLAMATSMQQLSPHIPSVVAAASRVNGAMMSLLVTHLPTPRPRSLYTLACKGVVGVRGPTSGRYCTVADCRLPSCRGNVLERLAPRSFVFATSHHKTERLVPVPDVNISSSAGSSAVLLDTLELVRAWMH